MKLRRCEIVQDHDKITIDGIMQGLDRKCIKDYAYILHDKDDTRPHYHITIRFESPQDTKYIAQWFGVPENMVNKVHGTWGDMLKYLTHANAQDKHQYDDTEVISNFNWIEERAREVSQDRQGEIIDGIVSGEIREYNYGEYITPHEYVKFSQAIEKAYKYRADKLRSVTRTMEAMYIQGDSGTGKTTYAKEIAEENKWSVYISSGSNDILDSYKGEDCIILDDLRASCIGLSDLLKMLDNNTGSTVKSRYRNKVLECKCIIITTVQPMEEFYNNVFKDENEPIIQFKRRCKTYIKMTRENLYISVYNPAQKDYMLVAEQPNPIMAMFDDEMTEEKAFAFIENALGGLLKGVKRVKSHKDDFKVVEDEDHPFK